jgi:osmotically-inducible protein OsmY
VKRILLLLAVAILALSANAFAAKNTARDPDADLVGRVRGALHASFGTAAWKIAVTAQEGFVFLYGDVPTDSVRVHAARIAAAVPGVREVENELAVAPGI